MTTQSDAGVRADALVLQEHMVALIRAFGLHKPDRTPCGVPVPVSEAHALMELARVPHLAQYELGERLDLEKSTVSRLVGQLHRRGWLRREQAADDARISLLSLTDEGRHTAAQLAAARSRRFARLLEGIPADRHADVLHALRQLAEAAHAHP
ncbi:MarR family transcriptional regulator [Spirillospora sp. NPDC047279]|uniref:MarR family winged helix-turn-helix transcriptional regulator n=1 Tax=Spirillospora sp. NPDC047279 TaxID=3155478 RepID=UPI0033DA32A5